MNDGDFSLWNGHRPFQLAPAAASVTRSPMICRMSAWSLMADSTSRENAMAPQLILERSIALRARHPSCSTQPGESFSLAEFPSPRKPSIASQQNLRNGLKPWDFRAHPKSTHRPNPPIAHPPQRMLFLIRVYLRPSVAKTPLLLRPWRLRQQVEELRLLQDGRGLRLGIDQVADARRPQHGGLQVRVVRDRHHIVRPHQPTEVDDLAAHLLREPLEHLVPLRAPALDGSVELEQREVVGHGSPRSEWCRVGQSAPCGVGPTVSQAADGVNCRRYPVVARLRTAHSTLTAPNPPSGCHPERSEGSAVAVVFAPSRQPLTPSR